MTVRYHRGRPKQSLYVCQINLEGFTRRSCATFSVHVDEIVSVFSGPMAQPSFTADFHSSNLREAHLLVRRQIRIVRVVQQAALISFTLKVTIRHGQELGGNDRSLPASRAHKGTPLRWETQWTARWHAAANAHGGRFGNIPGQGRPWLGLSSSLCAVHWIKQENES